MASKIIRDPLYNYVDLDRSRDGWLLDLLDCPTCPTSPKVKATTRA